MTNLLNKTPEELKSIIAEAQAQLEILKRNEHKEVIAKIKALAQSIGVTVEINEDGKKVSKKVKSTAPAKYRNPDDPSKTWSGNGMPPKWLKALTDAGHDKSEFLIND